MASKPAARRIRNGTRFEKSFSLVRSNRNPPVRPPSSAAGTASQSRFFWFFKSPVWASVPPRKPGQRAMVLVTLAATGERPMDNKVGKVMSVPPPARALNIPATNAARLAKMYFGIGMGLKIRLV